MRAWELMEGYAGRSERFTIRGLHKLKKDEKARLSSFEERQRLIPIIYGDPDWEREQLELQRLKLELEQLEAEIAATKAETEAKSQTALTANAKDGIKAMEQQRAKIRKMAARGVGRNRKSMP